MGFWKEVDIEIHNRMKIFGTSYDDEKDDAIQCVAKERYGKKDNAKMGRNAPTL